MARQQRQAIDQDEFNETAERLKAEGKKVTAVSMRQALGGGSYDTIYKYLNLWESRRPTAVVKEEIPVIPPSVQAGFANAWRMATEEAAIEIQVIKEKCAEEVNGALAQFHGALEAIAQIENERKAEAEATEGLHKLIAELKGEVAKAEAEAAAEKARADELREQLKAQQQDRDAALKEAANNKGQVEALKSQNAELMAMLDRSVKK